MHSYFVECPSLWICSMFSHAEVLPCWEGLDGSDVPSPMHCYRGYLMSVWSYHHVNHDHLAKVTPARKLFCKLTTFPFVNYDTFVGRHSEAMQIPCLDLNISPGYPGSSLLGTWNRSSEALKVPPSSKKRNLPPVQLTNFPRRFSVSFSFWSQRNCFLLSYKLGEHTGKSTCVLSIFSLCFVMEVFFLDNSNILLKVILALPTRIHWHWYPPPYSQGHHYNGCTFWIQNQDSSSENKKKGLLLICEIFLWEKTYNCVTLVK